MSGARVLLVEDDRSIVTVVSAALEAEGMAITTCESVAERDRLLGAGRYDLLITDVVLRDRDGLETLAPVRAAAPDMPVIVISAQNTLDTAVRASEMGAFEYFPKPFDLDQLSRAAVAAARGRSGGGDSALEPVMPEGALPLVGRSNAMQQVYRMVARLLRNDLSVLILGESGTGKEVVAEAIHQLGHRKTGPFVAVNMAAIPADLIEAELFGHEKGAFTGAIGQAIGKFEQAQGGTLFLDEIGDMPMAAQTRLLRALQTGVITRLGGRASIRLDVRIISATHRDLARMAEEGTFREDLYYRLNVVPIALPPLRDRREDIEALVLHFLGMAQEEGLPGKRIDPDAVALLRLHEWRGNVRELRNIVYRLVVTTRDDRIGLDEVEALLGTPAATSSVGEAAGFEGAVAAFLARTRNDRHLDGKLYEMIVAEVERPLLEAVLRKVKGNQLRAAALLGINRNTLRKKLADHAIRAGTMR